MTNFATVMKRVEWFLYVLVLVLLPAGCNSDNDIVPGRRPTIEFDSPDGVYTVRVGHDVRIDPIIGNGENASFRWTSADGEVIANTRALVMNCPRLGSFYVMLTVTSPAGSASAEARIDVLEQAPPVIDLSLPPDGIYLLPGQEYKIEPRIQHGDAADFSIEWDVDGEVVSDEAAYTFVRETTGTYHVTVRAANEDGTDSVYFDIHVVSQLPRALRFRGPSFMQKSTVRYTFPGRPVVLEPERLNISRDASCEWSVNGQTVDCDDAMYVFTPATPGTYKVAVRADGVVGEVDVVCVDATERDRMRAATSSSSPYIDKVWEYIPAPGQFIGDDSSVGGMPGDVTTHEQACRWAESRISSRLFVSLGACGGYIIAGFDHSVAAASVAELAVYGNAFDKSNEPGVVWVMQDVNGNGIPDDEWYELTGSACSDPQTQHRYAVTYYKPAGAQMDVEWTDCQGARGLVDYIPSAHAQASYYPAWVTQPSYTLYGTRLPDNGSLNNVTGQWATLPLAWGYADNMGSDLLQSGISSDGVPSQCVGLSISNAVMADGSPIHLQYVDFIRIQSGVMQRLGRLGESSTEVCSVADRTILKN